MDFEVEATPTGDGATTLISVYGELAARIDPSVYRSDVEPYRRARAVGAANGRVTAWVARFRVQVPPSYFIRLYVRWPDGKCGGPRQVLRTYALRAAG